MEFCTRGCPKVAQRCNGLQRIATDCNGLQRIATLAAVVAVCNPWSGETSADRSKRLRSGKDSKLLWWPSWIIQMSCGSLRPLRTWRSDETLKLRLTHGMLMGYPWFSHNMWCSSGACGYQHFSLCRTLQRLGSLAFFWWPWCFLSMTQQRTDETLEIFGNHWETLATRCVRQVAHSQAMRRSFGRRWKRRSL